MKPSIYNYHWDNKKKGESVLYNTYSGAVEVFSEKSAELVKNILLNNTDFSDLVTQLHINNLALRLYNKGFLIDKERDELSELQYQYKRNKYGTNEQKKWEIGIAPSMTCNFDCEYCYASVKSGSIMEFETQNLLIHRMKEYIDNNKIKHVNISWIGGEPLCNFKAIGKISEEIYKHCKASNCFFTASIVTNGSLLTNEIASQLAYPPYNIQYLQITIDAYWHDQSRPFRHNNKRSSLQATLAGLKEAAKKLPHRIWVRINVPCGKENITPKKIADFVIKLKQDLKLEDLVSFYLAPVQPHTPEARLGVEAIWPHRKFAFLYRAVEKRIAKHSELMYSPGMPSRSFMPCGYEYRDNICVDSNGYIYKCWHHLGVLDKVIGDISKPLTLENYFASNAYHIWSKWNPLTITKCKKCKFLPTCMGFCFDHAFELGRNDPGRCIRRKFTIKEDCYDQVEALLMQRFVSTLDAKDQKAEISKSFAKCTIKRPLKN